MFSVDGDNEVKTYEQFKEDAKDKKYIHGDFKCYACGKPNAYWELGDARYYCPGCEECAGVKKNWEFYLRQRLASMRND